MLRRPARRRQADDQACGPILIEYYACPKAAASRYPPAYYRRSTVKPRGGRQGNFTRTTRIAGGQIGTSILPTAQPPITTIQKMKYAYNAKRYDWRRLSRRRVSFHLTTAVP
jgi:hypothetical protein